MDKNITWQHKAKKLIVAINVTMACLLLINIMLTKTSRWS